MTEFSKLAQQAQYLPPDKLALVESAYNLAVKAHEGEFRMSGDPYIEHPLQVAIILAELQFDASTLAAALLHDVPENTRVTVDEISKTFNPEIAKLVDGMTRLDKITARQQGVDAPIKTGETQAENLRKMLVAMAEDLRVVFIKLADRLHNMKTLDALAPQRQRAIAQETHDIYAPLANRLGLWELKWQLEDLSFRYINEPEYHRIARLVVGKRTEREEYINRVIEILKAEFEKAGRRAAISGRPKHIYSIYQKMQRYASQGRDFDDIHDLLAVRVIVDTIPECYASLGIVHNLWRPLSENFNDYIANPKPNGYQSLHTTVMCLGTTPLEIQIRTREMHYASEHGVAAHWRYKEGEKQDANYEEKITWLRQLIEWHREYSGAEEFMESARTDIFIDQVFVFTPKGEIKDLPKGATPLDFAYRVHTELGHHTTGAKVNAKMVPLNYQLKNGDVIEIMTTKEDRGPSLDWLSPHLGYVQTASARTKIRQWFKKQERAKNIEAGRKILEKELRHLGIKLSEEANLAKQFKYPDVEDFFEAIGRGSINTHQIITRLADQEQTQQITVTTPATIKTPASISILGTKNLLTQAAKCCRPLPGDKVIGYVTRNRGVTIHRQDCYNIKHLTETERLVPVEWAQSEMSYPVNIEVKAWDRIGLIRDISTLLADEKVNISSVTTIPRSNHTVSVMFTLETKGLTQLSRLLARVEEIQGVTSAVRVGDKTTSRA